MQSSKQGENSRDSSSIFNIAVEGYNQLLIVGITLDHLYILEQYKKGLDPMKVISSSKAQANRQTLVRKGFILEDNSITGSGNVLLLSIERGKIVDMEIDKARTEVNTSFDLWWKEYPATDVLEYKGRKFRGTRALRMKKHDCRTKFDKILAEGEYTPEDLIKALRYEVFLKKEESFMTGANKMSFMPGSYTYLNQRGYENFIEIAKSEKIPDRPEIETDNCDI